jgi:hypothetical protein
MFESAEQPGPWAAQRLSALHCALQAIQPGDINGANPAHLTLLLDQLRDRYHAIWAYLDDRDQLIATEMRHAKL